MQSVVEAGANGLHLVFVPQGHCNELDIGVSFFDVLFRAEELVQSPHRALPVRTSTLHRSCQVISVKIGLDPDPELEAVLGVSDVKRGVTIAPRCEDARRLMRVLDAPNPLAILAGSRNHVGECYP